MNNNDILSDKNCSASDLAPMRHTPEVIVLSDSKKYKVIIENDDSGDQTTYTIFSSVEGETKHEKDKYKIVKIINVDNGNIIYKYKQLNSHSPINKFVKLGNQEWWFGGRDYMLQLFVNCVTCQVFDDPNKRELSNSYKKGYEFIWTGPIIVSPNGHFIFVTGCVWSFPCEWRFYDIRNITINCAEQKLIDLYDYLTIKEFDKEDERYQYADWLEDAEMFTFEFVTDDEITVKYYHNKEWKYFNTINLSLYQK